MSERDPFFKKMIADSHEHNRERASRPHNWREVYRAKEFHSAYERLAPKFGYRTRKETRCFDPDSLNGQLMIAVMKELEWMFKERRD